MDAIKFRSYTDTFSLECIRIDIDVIRSREIHSVSTLILDIVADNGGIIDGSP